MGRPGLTQGAPGEMKSRMDHKHVLKSAVLAASSALGTAALPAADFPQAEITNGQIQARLCLPDLKSGYYRGTRFDGSGVIGSLTFGGHQYYAPWFDQTDPKVIDFVYRGAEIVAGPCSAVTGPTEEFQTEGTALGWAEAKVGGTFIKIGVGVLRKDEPDYHYAKLYEVVDPGKWTVSQRAEAVEFEHELADPATGYGYRYRKVVRLAKDKPELVIEHRFKNTGQRLIRSRTYNHNFWVLDRLAPGPDTTITFPFPLRSSQPPEANLAQLRGNQFLFLKTLADQDRIYTVMEGYGTEARDYDIRIENRKAGAGLRITGDRPLSHLALWSIRSVVSVEPFIALTVAPGEEFTWTLTHQYYTLPKPGQ